MKLMENRRKGPKSHIRTSKDEHAHRSRSKEILATARQTLLNVVVASRYTRLRIKPVVSKCSVALRVLSRLPRMVEHLLLVERNHKVKNARKQIQRLAL